MSDELKQKYKKKKKKCARPKAIEWHKSQKGKEWHKKQYEINQNHKYKIYL